MLPQERPLLYLITECDSLPGGDLLALIKEAAGAGVNLVQIREKQLSDRDLCKLIGEVVEALVGTAVRILVNDRFDLAMACGAHGVQLTARSIRPAQVRRQTPRDFLIGVSTHSDEDVGEAERAGADFAVLGPVYDTPSKRMYGPPIGIGALRTACARYRLPVLAIGGMEAGKIREVRDAGAAGIAAIRWFACPGRLGARVGETLRDWAANP